MDRKIARKRQEKAIQVRDELAQEMTGIDGRIQTAAKSDADALLEAALEGGDVRAARRQEAQELRSRKDELKYLLHAAEVEVHRLEIDALEAEAVHEEEEAEKLAPEIRQAEAEAKQATERLDGLKLSANNHATASWRLKWRAKDAREVLDNVLKDQERLAQREMDDQGIQPRVSTRRSRDQDFVPRR